MRRPSETPVARIGGIAASLGCLTLLVATLLDPASAPPADAPAAFAEYAQSDVCVASHLGQLLGIVGITGGLLALALTLGRGGGRAVLWAVFGAAAAIASLATAITLQAVDGVALKMMDLDNPRGRACVKWQRD